MYIPIRHRPNSAGLAKGDPARTNNAYVQSGNHVVMGPKGLPMFKPPWSELVALNMDKGEQLWRVPIGPASDFVQNNPALKGLGLDFSKMGRWDIKPAALLMQDIIFLGESGNISDGTGGPMFRAFDKTDGKVVWEKELPGFVTGAPMTYTVNGKQMIVVAVSDARQARRIHRARRRRWRRRPGSRQRLAHARRRIRRARSGGQRDTRRTCDSAARPTPASALPATAPPAAGGAGPSLAGLDNAAEISRVINSGKGEMPAMASALSPAEVDAIGKFVASGFPRAGGGGPPARMRGEDFRPPPVLPIKWGGTPLRELNDELR